MTELLMAILTVVGLTAAWFVARGRKAPSGELPDPAPDPGPLPEPEPEPEIEMPPEPEPEPNTAPMPAWDDLLIAMRGDVPLDFLHRWIERESGGNPCSVGNTKQLVQSGYAREAGIGQLYFESATQRTFGVTSGELRAACSPTSQTRIRDLTQDERRKQVASLVAMAREYIAVARRRLAALGLTWDESHVLALAKLVHALPAIPKTLLPAANRAGEAGDWWSFRSWVISRTAAEITAVDRGVTPYLPLERLFINAEHTGGL